MGKKRIFVENYCQGQRRALVRKWARKYRHLVSDFVAASNVATKTIALTGKA